MHQANSLGLGLFLVGVIQWFVAGWLLIDAKYRPSEIRLTPREALQGVFRLAPLWLQWAFLKVLFWRFGRETLAAGLFVGGIYTWWHIT